MALDVCLIVNGKTNVEADVTSEGRLFHTRLPAIWNTRSLTVTHPVLRIPMATYDDERVAIDVRKQRFARYRLPNIVGREHEGIGGRSRLVCSRPAPATLVSGGLATARDVFASSVSVDQSRRGFQN